MENVTRNLSGVEVHAVPAVLFTLCPAALRPYATCL